MTNNAGPRLIGLDSAAAAAPVAVVLLLHGGQAKSLAPVRRGNLAALRMSLLARTAHIDRSMPVLALRYRYRGWNDEDGARTPDPVRDALDALARIEARLGPVPVILVGHSLGGRTAVRAAAYPTVRAVAALAPWLPLGEPVDALAGRTVLIAHGRRDRVTEIEHSIAYATRALAVADAVYLKLIDDGHAMLRAATTWHRLVREFCATVVLGPDAGRLDAERLGR
ncbi:alpha/beta fold hydrolase [Actinospica durhamensis]|uniref:Alpha/beta fold hydrolase n=1 Tax=Actinospica durhamensis TaxID=1508375 RepID=A0A941ISU3_9ACTN|nr:alpha/beta fold hydrolase [Actinospica durhamensis]MBR7836802.1 alpha/beta fold hydrolase [Actinospica durhamensis]